MPRETEVRPARARVGRVVACGRSAPRDRTTITVGGGVANGAGTSDSRQCRRGPVGTADGHVEITEFRARVSEVSSGAWRRF